jgi:hypothetical protein
LDKLEKGEYGPMWTRTGREKLRELLDSSKNVQKGALEELENTRLPNVET